MNKKIISVLNLICAALLLVTLVMQFLPFWTCLDCKGHKDVEKDISLAEYVWLPGHHEGMEEQMTDLYKDTYGRNYRFPDGRKFKFQPNEVLPTVLPGFVGAIFGMILCVWKRQKFFVAAIPLYVGIAGIVGYTTCLALTVGMNVGAHLAVAIAVAAVGGVTFVLGGILALRAKMKKKAQ